MGLVHPMSRVQFMSGIASKFAITPIAWSQPQSLNYRTICFICHVTVVSLHYMIRHVELHGTSNHVLIFVTHNSQCLKLKLRIWDNKYHFWLRTCMAHELTQLVASSHIVLSLRRQHGHACFVVLQS